MSQFVTHDQMIDFFNKKSMMEEAEPEKAKLMWTSEAEEAFIKN